MDPRLYSPYDPTHYSPNLYMPNPVFAYGAESYSGPVADIIGETQKTMLWIVLAPVVILGVIVTTVIIVKLARSIKKDGK